LALLLFILLSTSSVHSKTINVNPISLSVDLDCGSLLKACKTLDVALKIAEDGDIISLSVGTHLISASIVVNNNIEVTIKGKGKALTTIKLLDGVSIDLYQVNLIMFDLTISGGKGLSINAMAQVLDVLGVKVDLNVHIYRCKFLNIDGGLQLYSPDPELFGVLGSIEAVIENVIFSGSVDLAVTIGTNVDVTFNACVWLGNLNGVLRLFGASNNSQCPKVTISACTFKNNQAADSLITAGTNNCDDLLVFVGVNLFQQNIATVLLGYQGESQNWNYSCDDCDLKLVGNQLEANCGLYCASGDCGVPPAFPDVDVNICLLGIGIDLSVALPVVLPILGPLPISLPVAL